MKTKYSIYIFLFLLISCNSNDDEQGFTPTLPAITQTGANTFGCYINGSLLTPRNGTGSVFGPDYGMIYSALGESPNYTYNEIDIHDFKTGNGGLMDIHIVNLHENGEGEYIINQSNCLDNVDANPNVNIRCRMWDEISQTLKWYCSIDNTGSLNITRYDFENRIISGTFNCTAVNRNNSNELIEITEGRFDIHWDTLPDVLFP